MKTKIITLTISLTVGIILVASLLFPVLEDMEKDYKVTNAFGNLATLDEDGDDAISGVFDNTGIEINSQKWTRSDLTYNWTSPIVADTFVIKTLVMADSISAQFACIINGTSTVISSNIASITVTADDGSAAVVITYSNSNPDTSLTIPYNWVAYMNGNGDHVIQTLPWSGTFEYRAYYNSMNDIRGADYKSSTFYSYVGDDVTYGTTSYTSSATTADVSGVVNVHYMDNDGANLVFNSNIYIGVLVVPLTVYGTTEAMDTYAGLLNVIPLLLLVGILVAAVGYIMVRRNES